MSAADTILDEPGHRVVEFRGLSRPATVKTIGI